MQRSIFIFGFSILVFFKSFAQGEGIVFFEGTWAEVLQEAKASNKLIFIDAYAVWCKPCKLMAQEVFPKPEVAAFYNANFINYKIDVDKEEGGMVANKYKVKAMPTYLFVDASENLRYSSLGYIQPEAFIQVGKDALNPKKQNKVK